MRRIWHPERQKQIPHHRLRPFSFADLQAIDGRDRVRDDKRKIAGETPVLLAAATRFRGEQRQTLPG